jgi:hypothetical protein
MKGVIGTLLLATSVATLPAFVQVSIPEDYEKTRPGEALREALRMNLFGEYVSFYIAATGLIAQGVMLRCAAL